MKKLLSILLLALISANAVAMELASIDQVREKLKEMYQSGRMTTGCLPFLRYIKTVYQDGRSTTREIPFDEQVVNVEGLRILRKDLMPLLLPYINLHLTPLAAATAIERQRSPRAEQKPYPQHNGCEQPY